MGLHLRKSVRVGPFRFNLSQSGIGVSAGIKGLRVGTGPRGNYIHMGRGGLYYRHTFADRGNVHAQPSLIKPPQKAKPELLESSGLTHEPLREIDSGEIGLMVDSTSKALVDELNAKRRRPRGWPMVAVLCMVVAGLLSARSAPPWATLTALGIGLAVTALVYYWDLLGKTTVMLYDLEKDFESTLEQLHSAFGEMMKCGAVWHLEAEGKVTDRKYHAGASHLVRRNGITLAIKNPPFVKTNVVTPSIPVGKQTLYFFPDKVLVFEPNGVGAVSYDNLQIAISSTNFIEDGSVPRDAEIVSKTWKFVNKSGGPDRRFKDNRQIPVVRYEEVQFSSSTGLNERIQLSRLGQSSALSKAIGAIGRITAERI
ncbi:DUF4236 domain-containing protein [Stutzerimonas stutzeri]|uniref:DUF4236 domain-containing protein n=1 Tax=Stutzerimonas stutzeri TaxID=316 RepID=UPI001C796D12|nr:DUF4236 domain-containing protein [Stutzerimonas stutzeri]BCY02061.1 membrane protein [Stutzerimonas stutzeri]